MSTTSKYAALNDAAASAAMQLECHDSMAPECHSTETWLGEAMAVARANLAKGCPETLKLFHS